MPHYRLAAQSSPQLLGSILDELELLGQGRAHVFRAAGVGNSTHIIESELSSNDRSTLFNYSCCLLAAESGQHSELNGFVEKDITDMLMYCVITCKDLNQVIKRTVTFCSMVDSIGINLQLKDNGTQAELTVDSGNSAAKHSSLLLTLAAMSTLYNLFSWLLATDLPLVRVGLRHTKPNQSLPTFPLQNQPIYYQCTTNHFTFSSSWLSRPVARSYEQLMQIIDYFPASLLSLSTGDRALSLRVKKIIQSSFKESVAPITANIAAQLVNLSSSTLRRKLHNEGTDFTQLLTLCRQAEAERCLVSRTHIKNIALQLGFSDERAFRRAFKRWTGKTPTDFRRQYQCNQVPSYEHI